ncbi:hypothetical protein [Clostridium sp. C2-6-12]|uniref:hypothetical protein n=1 Tax=Clostridium sp. C2-6-12 TaxID=2698832 RepID=UPI00136E9E8D|nr:hypothetical protein [Clostridium sp. C2-6-12]
MVNINKISKKFVTVAAAIATVMTMGAVPAHAELHGKVVDTGQTMEQSKQNSKSEITIKGDRGDIGKGTGVMLPFRTPNYQNGTSAFNEKADSSHVKIVKGFITSDLYLIQNDGSTAKWQDKFYSEDGVSLVKNNWRAIDGKWYFFTQSGNAARGWYKVNDKQYHFDEATGAMTTNWFQGDTMSDRGIWYYLDSNSGVMQENAWLQSNGTWYYLGQNGEMQIGSRIINGTSYHFEADGKMTN